MVTLAALLSEAESRADFVNPLYEDTKWDFFRKGVSEIQSYSVMYEYILASNPFVQETVLKAERSLKKLAENSKVFVRFYHPLEE
jgi:hypothetical protein